MGDILEARPGPEVSQPPSPDLAFPVSVGRSSFKATAEITVLVTQTEDVVVILMVMVIPVSQAGA